ncbi:hypothetical protein HW115_01935 [Verrucomicrobiaceae bacterium N1E253]|uniref:Acyl-protein synthetase LuxE domain-containing protein n=1 Tax=Oceaniferula marina TaxID=2748318 RepID=A0A851GJJ3_9BACT|nr:hypothetical protein [Oceaniferula marina]NWK54354.1 hypothetical protein [Oceaniferula marina]
MNWKEQNPPPDPSAKIAEAIVSGALDDESFNRRALELFDYQFSRNLPYQRYCEHLDALPGKVSFWGDIPAIPTDAFKQHAHPLICRPDGKHHPYFQTSGTTTDIKGRHYFPSFELYEQSILRSWKLESIPPPQRALFLVAHPQQAPRSSLSHMMGVLDQQHQGGEKTWGLEASGALDLQSIQSCIAHSVDSLAPLAILGTALAFLHLLESCTIPVQLPPGSWIMETGGYKGSQRSLSKQELYRRLQNQFGIPPKLIVNEYSMTELSSQFYTRGLENAHHGPPWTRIRVVDPITGMDASSGSPGHLAIYDLANTQSVQAIQTQDLAVAHGPHSFFLLGRDPSALPRGCSRGADATFSSTP